MVENRFEIQTESARLSGDLDYMDPFPWQIKIEGELLSIIPNNNGRTELVKFFIYLAIVGFPCIFWILWNWSDSPHDFWLAFFGALAPNVGLLLVAGYVDWLRRRDLKAGPWFHFSKSDGAFYFPRLQLRLSRSQVVRWDLISGCWVRGGNEETRLWGDQISELQFVFQDQGKLFALPLLGGSGLKTLDLTAEAIAEFTNLELEYMVQKKNCVIVAQK